MQLSVIDTYLLTHSLDCSKLGELIGSDSLSHDKPSAS